MFIELLLCSGKFVIGICMIFFSYYLCIYPKLLPRIYLVILLSFSTARDLSVSNILVSPVIPDYYPLKMDENEHVVL
jgi:hypothetical protein